MNAKQNIFRVRRSYNQWVNNQTLEDYALRFTAKRARKWSLSRVANTALGAISFLALEAIGGAITISYGFDNASIAILVVGLIIFLAGIPICYYAAKYGVDIDLLTRGAGFGYIGSTATSLIYASFTFIFFALEAAIMAMALKLLFSIPLSIGYIICSVIVIPLVTHGITFISRFQLWTQPLWVILQILPFVFILTYDSGAITGWQNFSGVDNKNPEAISLIYFGAAAAVLFSLIAQIGEQVDFLRFLPEKRDDNQFRWWLAMIAAGPGWVIIGVLKIFAGSLLAYIAFNNGADAIEASDPTNMYMIAFQYMTNHPQSALLISGIFVILSQLKINVTNAYAGSIAWSNFFSRLTHSHPGRVVWLVFNVIIALLLMEIGVYQAFEQTLGAYAIVAVSWVSTLVADLVINKPLKLSPKHIEFRRAYLHDINPVGVGSMIISSALGVIFYIGVFGEELKAVAHFVTILSAFILAPTIAFITKGKFYLARAEDNDFFEQQEIECCICQNHYEKEDIAFCPAYDGPICSLCCSLDARCQDMCKQTKKIYEQILDFFEAVLPYKIASSLNTRLIRFGLLAIIISSIIGALLAISYINAQTGNTINDSQMANLLWRVFLILIIVVGVISWLFVLAHESRHVAQEESQRQNKLLIKEIEAHQETDKELQRAKERAEAANNAKSRYLTGISHELRTPLNSILGYAQLLEIDDGIALEKRSKISVIKRSGEHLGNLIEGLLDISKIEAGRLDIIRDQVRISSLFDQIVYMFHLQAQEKGLKFIYECINPLPEFVTTDEKRLRQILINLLSNAIKFTPEGEVSLTIKYRNQVAEIQVKDSGIGIPESEMERIFKPFERITNADAPPIPGTGLGLTITQLLTDIMGGDIQVRNNPDKGTTFTVSLMLSDIISPESIKDPLPSLKVHGYEGDKRIIMVVDDDPNHRALIKDILSPLGFILLEATSGDKCLEAYDIHKPDLYLLDISMPGENGWQVAEKLRQRDYQKPIIIVSANANETDQTNLHPNVVNDYIIKPIQIETLIDKLGSWLAIEWLYESVNYDEQNNNLINSLNLTGFPTEEIINELIALAEIGHMTELKRKIKEIGQQGKAAEEFVTQMQTWLQEVRFDKIVDSLRKQNYE
ncbi:MAG: hybrid sensor histidine kinase/response regulator [Cellvibrionaceae bacterium]